MQVSPSIGLTFARALRSFLRHNPNIVMVGEIRDLETAEVAVQVALTGHLFLLDPVAQAELVSQAPHRTHGTMISRSGRRPMNNSPIVFSFAVTELIPQSPKIDILKPRGLPTTGSTY